VHGTETKNKEKKDKNKNRVARVVHWSIIKLSRSSSQVKVKGQGSRSREENKCSPNAGVATDHG